MPRQRKKQPVRDTTYPIKQLTRSQRDRVIAGVAGGLGEYFDIDPTLIRMVFILITIFGGSGVIIYLALWLIIPPYRQARFSENGLEGDIQKVRDKTMRIRNEIRFSSHRPSARIWWGILITVAGFLFLFNNFGFFTIFDFTKIWPLILIIFGVIILLRK